MRHSCSCSGNGARRQSPAALGWAATRSRAAHFATDGPAPAQQPKRVQRRFDPEPIFGVVSPLDA